VQLGASNEPRPTLPLALASWFSCLSALAVLFMAPEVGAQIVDTDLRTTFFVEPSEESRLIVITPAVDLGVHPWTFLEVRLGWEADIVSGATEAVKAGPIADAVSAATEFKDTRHLVRGGFTVTGETTRLSADYSFGTESDYHSNAISVSAGTDFFQKNTQIDLSYARGFDTVCTAAYTPSTAPSARTSLDSSEGCFTDESTRAEREADLTTFQAAWTQAWTPVLAMQLVLTGSIQHGFLENPYRSVVIAPAGQFALENHPDERQRGAVALRGKYFLKSLQAALGAGVRVYRDTWDIVGQTYEIEAEKYITSGMRVLARGRYYTQTGALFYSDDYTGGEPVNGPRGQYWTGDRELSPLSSYLLGGRVLYGAKGGPDARILGILLGFQVSASFDFLKTSLDNFTWASAEPTDTTALIFSGALRGEF
jgi:hypothetical protein